MKKLTRKYYPHQIRPEVGGGCSYKGQWISDRCLKSLQDPNLLTLKQVKKLCKNHKIDYDLFYENYPKNNKGLLLYDEMHHYFLKNYEGVDPNGWIPHSFGGLGFLKFYNKHKILNAINKIKKLSEVIL
jgi:hypothetical protein